jgi:hypothetical protein
MWGGVAALDPGRGGGAAGSPGHVGSGDQRGPGRRAVGPTVPGRDQGVTSFGVMGRGTAHFLAAERSMVLVSIMRLWGPEAGEMSCPRPFAVASSPYGAQVHMASVSVAATAIRA